jgi:hypothetical protein
MSAIADPARRAVRDTRYPPVAPCVVASLISVIVGGIWMASYFPRRPPLSVPAASCALGVVLLAVAAVLLSRIERFGWQVFRQVWRWTLLAYAAIAGLIEYAFVHNGAAGKPLALVSVMLVVFALDVATVVAATVARYQRAPAGSPARL